MIMGYLKFLVETHKKTDPKKVPSPYCLGSCWRCFVSVVLVVVLRVPETHVRHPRRLGSLLFKKKLLKQIVVGKVLVLSYNPTSLSPALLVSSREIAPRIDAHWISALCYALFFGSGFGFCALHMVAPRVMLLIYVQGMTMLQLFSHLCHLESPPSSCPDDSAQKLDAEDKKKKKRKLASSHARAPGGLLEEMAWRAGREARKKLCFFFNTTHACQTSHSETSSLHPAPPQFSLIHPP